MAGLVGASLGAIAPSRNLAAEPRDEVTFEDVRPDPGAVAPSPVDDEALRRRESFGRAVLMLGAMEAVRDMTIDLTRRTNSSAAASPTFRRSSTSWRTSPAKWRSPGPPSMRRPRRSSPTKT